jgi:hypothetical protein
MADLETEELVADVMQNSLGAEEQDLLPVLEQLEIQDLGELSLIAWRII